MKLWCSLVIFEIIDAHNLFSIYFIIKKLLENLNY